MKRFISLLVLALILMPNLSLEAKAASALDVVINEIAWGGSLDDSSDEWIELKNNTDSEVDLTGWTIVDDETSTYELSGTIAANGYFLIESHEDAVSGVDADLIVGLSLANSGDTLVLYDADGSTIDTVNSSGGDWPAGDNDTKASMERVDPESEGSDNWSDCTTSSGYTASGGSEILGTPGSLNSVSESSTGTTVTLTVSDEMPASGDTITVTATITDVEELFSYGLDIEYDSAVLTYQSTTEGDFLSETSFNAELEDSTEGTLVIGGARTQEDKEGVSGDGTLFEVEFLVADNPGASSDITISNSFIANLDEDIEASFESTSITVEASASQAENAAAAEGEERYSVTLTWDEPTDGADYYRILRLDSAGDYEELTTTTETTYTDDSYIIPDNTYSYQIITVLGSSESEAIEVTGSDSRGVKGDSNRSDRVDGRDLENLAKHYGETSLDEDYDVLIDTTYDGNINGSDLIDLGVNWALTYSD